MVRLTDYIIIGLACALATLGFVPLPDTAPYTFFNPYQTEYEEMLYPTVRVRAGTGTGSGVIFHHRDAEDAENTIYILSAAHVVRDLAKVKVELYHGASLDASVVITDTAKDLALLRISNRDCFADARNDKVIRSAKLASRNYTPYLFTPVWVVGCSLGLPLRPSFGHITAIPLSPFAKRRIWEVSAPIAPGNSGGPVFHAKTYELIGIAVWVRTYRGQLITTMAGVVPIQQIYKFLEPQIHTD